MRVLLRPLFACALSLLWCLTCAGQSEGAPAAQKSPVLRAMEEELQRSVGGLKEKGDPAPYFLSYHITEEDSISISTSRGAVRFASRDRSRLLDVETRVGDYDLDNTRRFRGDRFGFERRFSRPVSIPVEDDVAAIKAALWLETDRKYKESVERLIQVRTDTAVKVKEEDTSADFSRDTPQTFLGPLARLSLDAAGWEKRLKEHSAHFKNYQEIYESDVSLAARATTKYFVNSEGAVIQQGSLRLRVSVYARTKADDGMDLYRYESFDAHSPERLPEDKTLRQTIEHIAKDLLALRAAPAVEPYTGPAILSGRAAGVFFHEIFGHRIEGHRQKDEQEGQTFTKKVNEAVLPDFLDVYDDPTRQRVGDRDLNGHYAYDDEGVKAQRVPVVQKGVLKNFLMSRSPVAGFTKSNGHGRKQAGFRAVGRQGNLIVETSQTVSEEKLRGLLMEECRKQGKPFGRFFKDVGGGFTFTGRGMPQAFQVTPILVFRVYADGRPDELVRGVDLIGTPLVSFSKILASGATPEVFNGVCGAESGWVPVSAVAPSILTGQIEIQKQQKSFDRPPLLPPPGERAR